MVTVSTFSQLCKDILRAAASAMQTPVIIILLLFMAFAVFSIGWIISEGFVERAHMKAKLPRLLDSLKAAPKDMEEIIDNSELLSRQKTALRELNSHPYFNKEMLESLGANLVEAEQFHYDRILKLTDLVSKLAPMCGLLGTLIPLGPGIIALGQGDTYTLSNSLLTAFDTTIAGLLAAGVCLTISTIRRRWYAEYMSDLETLAECVIEIIADHESEREGTNQYEQA